MQQVRLITDGSCTKECAEYIEELMNNENNRGERWRTVSESGRAED